MFDQLTDETLLDRMTNSFERFKRINRDFNPINKTLSPADISHYLWWKWIVS